MCTKKTRSAVRIEGTGTLSSFIENKTGLKQDITFCNAKLNNIGDCTNIIQLSITNIYTKHKNGSYSNKDW